MAREAPYTLFVNDREILSIATLPTHLKELFIGFLVSEGILLRPKEILECAVDHAARIVRVELDVPEDRLAGLERKGMLTSGCAGGVIFSVEAAATRRQHNRKRLKVSTSTIIERMKELDRYPGLYKVTRGVHAASLADAERTYVVLEDLGRHNAVDKIAGYCFLNHVETRDKLLLSTGRITSEVLIKAARSNFPVIISRSSASSVAIATAKQQHIDVATYVRAGRFNYFSHGATELVQG
ncbi:MAG: formate dehydrogenase accessory sulfurtransferase FdhD [Deltaproteobacteria bacterium]